MKPQWIVRARCVIVKQIVCENCTEEEARDDPWEHAVDETEIEQIDWDVTQVTKG
jgi:hypothetical protein